MRFGSVPETVAALPWVRPSPAVLLALTDDPVASAWSRLRLDPGLVLLLVRFNPHTADFAAVLQSPTLLDHILDYLSNDGTWGSPGQASQEIRGWCVRYATAAEQLARTTKQCDPERAWVAALLAPLGWLALGESAPALVQACQAQEEYERNPAAVQSQLWGLDHAALVRRLTRAWNLPDWLTAVIGHLALPVGVAESLRAEPGLFTIVQQAVRQVQTESRGLQLAVCTEQVPVPSFSISTLPVEPLGPDAEVALDILKRLLRLTAANRRLRQEALVARLENEVDQLHRLLEQRPVVSGETLQSLKLRALAEFAAGAGHEINNPLAVISGQVQYLLGYETDPARRKPMETIIAQTQRIHRLLRDVMQFARPTPPRKQTVTLLRLLEKVAAGLELLVQEKQVTLELRPAATDLQTTGDPAQLESIVSAVVRNAIEAAGKNGSVRVWSAAAETLEIHVEDSGPGLTPIQREHLFDPFYSGRDAGRGVGLGLSLAWSLVRQHDGDILLASRADEPTHFIVRLPLFLSTAQARAS